MRRPILSTLPRRVPARAVALTLAGALLAACGTDDARVGTDAPASPDAAQDLTGEGEAIDPQVGAHWHAAFGILVCGEWQAPMVDDPTVRVHNLHTHSDGLIHIHPNTAAGAGANATLGLFFETVALSVGDDSVTVAGGPELRCDGEQVRLAVWEVTARDELGRPTTWAAEPTIVEGDPADHRPQDDSVIALVLDPRPPSELPQPPSATALGAPMDEAPAPPPTS